MCMKKKVCVGCEQERKLNSRGYCVKCWNFHQEKVCKAKKFNKDIPVRVLKRWSLKGLIEHGF